MKGKKAFVILVLSLSLVICLTGCSGTENLKDNIIGGYNTWLQSFSKHALTKEKDLQGDKENGIDEYTGTYTADYDKFNGTEFIFGGTALERENGSKLTATYTLEVSSGTVTLYWLAGGEEHTIESDSANDVFKFTIGSGDNYIVLEGENFSGSLEIMVE